MSVRRRDVMLLDACNIEVGITNAPVNAAAIRYRNTIYTHVGYGLSGARYYILYRELSPIWTCPITRLPRVKVQRAKVRRRNRRTR